MLRHSFSSSANPPPVPPSVYAGRSTTGYPMVRAASSPSSTDSAISEGRTGSPILSHSSLNFSRSSASSMLLVPVPRSLTSHSSSTPFFSRATAMFNPVCPPIPARIASGRSIRIIFATNSRVSGSMYTLSAMTSSVIIVAGFELHSTTSYPSSRSARHACVPA